MKAGLCQAGDFLFGRLVLYFVFVWFVLFFSAKFLAFFFTVIQLRYFGGSGNDGGSSGSEK